jgi:hypothetical protein
MNFHLSSTTRKTQRQLPTRARSSKTLRFLNCSAAILLVHAGVAHAVTLRLGQNTNVTVMDLHTAWFTNDPGNLLPWPDSREAISADNSAHVSLSATPGHAGVAQATIGLQLQWDLGGRSWDDVRDTAVRVSCDFSYQVEAYWTLWTGSGNSWISSWPGGTIDSLGWETQETGQRSNRITLGTDARLEDLGDSLGFIIGCQAHSATNFTAINSSDTQITIHSVTLEFPQTLTGHVYSTWDGSPVPAATVLVNNYYAATTDSAGYYTISGFPPGTCAATVSHTNYCTTNVTFTVPADPSTSTAAFYLTPRYFITFYHEPPINSLVGHAFVSLAATGGAKQFYGFYPAGFVLAGPGKVADDRNTPWDYAISYPVRTPQYVSAGRAITHDIMTPPFYTLAGFNCMSWAAKIASVSGIILPSYLTAQGIPASEVFGSSLAALGPGATYNGGKVLQNAHPPPAPEIAYPYDFSYTGIETAGHTNASSLAADIGLKYEHTDLGTINANATDGVTIALTGVGSPQALISMNWGDGTAFEEQCTTLSHVFSNGTYAAHLLIIENGAVHSYDLGVTVSSAPATYTNITVVPYPAMSLPNQGLIDANWVPNYPPPSVQSISLRPNGHALVTFAGAQAETYLIQSATNLSLGFAIVTNATAGTNGLFLYDDPNAPNNRSTFYRAVWP